MLNKIFASGSKINFIFLFTFVQLSFRDCPANKYMLKINKRNTRKMCEICSEVTIRLQNDMFKVNDNFIV